MSDQFGFVAISNGILPNRSHNKQPVGLCKHSEAIPKLIAHGQ